MPDEEVFDDLRSHNDETADHEHPARQIREIGNDEPNDDRAVHHRIETDGGARRYIVQDIQSIHLNAQHLEYTDYEWEEIDR